MLHRCPAHTWQQKRRHQTAWRTTVVGPKYPLERIFPPRQLVAGEEINHKSLLAVKSTTSFWIEGPTDKGEQLLKY